MRCIVKRGDCAWVLDVRSFSDFLAFVSMCGGVIVRPPDESHPDAFLVEILSE